MKSIPKAALPEIAFAGRSNVGKSSLINTLTNRKKLARVSGSPGCTSQINFYRLGERLMLADLPGYGYARKSKQTLKDWGKLIRSYLRGRASLQRVCLLIDARRGVGELDQELMNLLDEAAVVYQIVFTKIDAITKKELEQLLEKTEILAKSHPALHPIFHTTSSEKKRGIEELQRELSFFAMEWK